MRHLNYIEKRQRLRLARQCIYEGLNTTDFASRAGISLPQASRWLKLHAPEHLSALKENSRYAALHPETVLNRLRVIAQNSPKKAANILNMSRTGLRYFITAYAPDGIESALSEYEEAYGVPLLESANQQEAAA
jgi:hypothetical protein